MWPMYFAVFSQARRTECGVYGTPSALSPLRTSASPPHAFGEAMEVPFISVLRRSVHCGTGAIAPPGALMHTPRCPFAQGPRDDQVYWMSATVSVPLMQYSAFIIGVETYAPTPISSLVVLPGAPTVVSAGPAFPAEETKMTLCVLTRRAQSSGKRPLFGVEVGSPYDMLTRSHLLSMIALTARTIPMFVSIEPRRVSPILTETICAPGATPSMLPFSSGRYAAVIPATWVPCEPQQTTIVVRFPSS
mmetsp:Transcript_18197/g.44668  ORF Transcript_18197/g.44668 Transcript_18197/m.44668 type:complete len:247 (-) Transcript_18197:339-1079(-)